METMEMCQEQIHIQLHKPLGFAVFCDVKCLRQLKCCDFEKCKDDDTNE